MTYETVFIIYIILFPRDNLFLAGEWRREGR